MENKEEGEEERTEEEVALILLERAEAKKESMEGYSALLENDASLPNVLKVFTEMKDKCEIKKCFSFLGNLKQHIKQISGHRQLLLQYLPKKEVEQVFQLLKDYETLLGKTKVAVTKLLSEAKSQKMNVECLIEDIEDVKVGKSKKILDDDERECVQIGLSTLGDYISTEILENLSKEWGVFIDEAQNISDLWEKAAKKAAKGMASDNFYGAVKSVLAGVGAICVIGGAVLLCLATAGIGTPAAAVAAGLASHYFLALGTAAVLGVICASGAAYHGYKKYSKMTKVYQDVNMTANRINDLVNMMLGSGKNVKNKIDDMNIVKNQKIGEFYNQVCDQKRRKMILEHLNSIKDNLDEYISQGTKLIDEIHQAQEDMVKQIRSYSK